MFRHLVYLPAIALLAACNDFLSPVDSTPAPSEYEYNYWLLQKTYLYGEELAAIPEEGDSVQALFSVLTDRYTRYTEPSHSEAVIESRNTSIITGDIGVEFLRDVSLEHPLFINRVYPESPADRASPNMRSPSFVAAPAMVEDRVKSPATASINKFFIRTICKI